MKPEYQHKILVVVDDKKIGDTLKNIFLAKKNDCVLVNKGESALDAINKTEQPFSVITHYPNHCKHALLYDK